MLGVDPKDLLSFKLVRDAGKSEYSGGRMGTYLDYTWALLQCRSSFRGVSKQFQKQSKCSFYSSNCL